MGKSPCANPWRNPLPLRGIRQSASLSHCWTPSGNGRIGTNLTVIYKPAGGLHGTRPFETILADRTGWAALKGRAFLTFNFWSGHSLRNWR